MKARINRSDAETIRQALDQLSAKGSVRKEGDEFLVEAETEGASAKEVNRALLYRLEEGGKENDAPCGMNFGGRHQQKVLRLRSEHIARVC